MLLEARAGIGLRVPVLTLGRVMLCRRPGTRGGAVLLVLSLLVEDRKRSDPVEVPIMSRGMLAIRPGMVGQLSSSKSSAGMDSIEIAALLSKLQVIMHWTGTLFSGSADSPIVVI